MQYTFTNYGVHNVELIVVDSGGCTDTTVQVVIVDSVDVGFSIDDTTNICSNTVCFTDTSLSAFYGSAPGSYFWNFGDAGTLADTSTAAAPCYSYSTYGHSTISLTVATVNGCVDSVTTTIYVPEPPTSDFTMSDSAGCEPLTVTFMDASTVDGTTVIQSWEWTFDGINQDNLQNPFPFDFLNFGTYFPQLVVTDGYGCTDTAIAQVDVYDIPQADFTFGNVCAGNPTTFNSTSIAGLDGVNPITEYYWNFDEGAGSNLGGTPENYQYVTTGNFNVELIIVDAGGCSDTIVKPLTMYPPPQAIIVAPDTVACLGDITEGISYDGSSSLPARHLILHINGMLTF